MLAVAGSKVSTRIPAYRTDERELVQTAEAPESLTGYHHEVDMILLIQRGGSTDLLNRGSVAGRSDRRPVSHRTLASVMRP
jgi:hypothetical protein